MMDGTLSLYDVLQAAKRVGAGCSTITFWRYAKAGLVPKGRTVKGGGNVLRLGVNSIYALYALAIARHVGIPVKLVQRNAIRMLAHEAQKQTGGDPSKLPTVASACEKTNAILEASIGRSLASAFRSAFE